MKYQIITYQLTLFVWVCINTLLEDFCSTFIKLNALPLVVNGGTARPSGTDGILQLTHILEVIVRQNNGMQRVHPTCC